MLAVSAFAQSEVATATINGTILDPSGAQIAGAKVSVRNPATGVERSTVTTSAGLYSISRLPVGDYDLSVEMNGFKTARVPKIALTVGATQTLDIRLEIGQTSESVTVNADVPVVETTRSTASTTVEEKAVSDLPVNGRNFLDFVTLTPGVVRDPTRGGDLSFGGQRGPANSLLVDGADSNNLFFGQATGRTGFRPYAFSQDAVQEFQVNANNFPAEVGRAGGGAINVITKSGTNDFHGSAFWFFRDKGLNANTFVNNRIGRVKQPYHFNQFGGSLGGPVFIPGVYNGKNKLFFFANYDGQKNTDTQIVSPIDPVPPALLGQFAPYLAPYPLTLDNNVFLAKIDYNLSDKDRLNFRYNGSRYTGQNRENNGLSRSRESTGNNKVNTNNYAFNYVRTIGTTVVLDTRFNYVQDKQPGEANATGPEVNIDRGIVFGRNNFSPRYTNTNAYQPIANVTWVKGKHTFKTGLDFNFVRAENFFPGQFAGQYFFANYQAYINRTPSRYVQAFSGTSTEPPISRPNVDEYAFFAQDSWRATRKLTLNYGIRYDYFNYNQPTTLVNNPQLLAANLRTDRIPTDKNNWAPRFGFAYNLVENKVVLRGGYGVYYARVPGLLLSTAILQNGIDVVTFTFLPGDPLFPTFPNTITRPPVDTTPRSIYVTDPNFRTPLTQQFNFQVESQIAKDMSVTVGYLGVNGTKLTRSRDINLFPARLRDGVICPTSSACTASQGTPVQYWAHDSGRPNPAFSRITLFESGGNSIYHGGFVQLTKRYAHNYLFQASYTFSKVIDSAPDGTSVVVGNAGDDAKVAQNTLAPNLERGLGNADIRHRFVASAVWDITYGNSMKGGWRYLFGDWQLGFIMQAQSGRPYSELVTGDPNNDTNQNNDRSPLLGRNTISGPAFRSLDVRVTKAIPFGERFRLQLIGEAFNITNTANFSAINNTRYSFRSGQYLQPTTPFLFPQNTFDPRVLQLAAKITF
jgi:outer membrane receptor protein involved in Fe transport